MIRLETTAILVRQILEIRCHLHALVLNDNVFVKFLVRYPFINLILNERRIHCLHILRRQSLWAYAFKVDVIRAEHVWIYVLVVLGNKVLKAKIAGVHSVVACCDSRVSEVGVLLGP